MLRRSIFLIASLVVLARGLWRKSGSKAASPPPRTVPPINRSRSRPIPAMSAPQRAQAIRSDRQEQGRLPAIIWSRSRRPAGAKMGCGRLRLNRRSCRGRATNPAPAEDEEPQSVQSKPALCLAIGWQAAFCETRPSKRECANARPNDRFDATHFTLHGLWPQPRRRAYCGVDEAHRFGRMRRA